MYGELSTHFTCGGICRRVIFAWHLLALALHVPARLLLPRASSMVFVEVESPAGVSLRFFVDTTLHPRSLRSLLGLNTFVSSPRMWHTHKYMSNSLEIVLNPCS